MQPCPRFDNDGGEDAAAAEVAAVRQRLRDARIRSLASSDQAASADRSREERWVEVKISKIKKRKTLCNNLCNFHFKLMYVRQNWVKCVYLHHFFPNVYNFF